MKIPRQKRENKQGEIFMLELNDLEEREKNIQGLMRLEITLKTLEKGISETEGTRININVANGITEMKQHSRELREILRKQIEEELEEFIELVKIVV